MSWASASARRPRGLTPLLGYRLHGAAPEAGNHEYQDLGKAHEECRAARHSGYPNAIVRAYYADGRRQDILPPIGGY